MVKWYAVKEKDMNVDYSKKQNWLSLSQSTKCVDTFFLYPSSYVSPKDKIKPFADIQNEKMKKIAGKCLDIQASAFAQDTNVYAPLYRQVDPEYGFKMIAEGREDLVNEVLLRDAIDSFEYFLNYYNDGKPFILAGHSQGTTLLMKLMAIYLKEHKDVLDRMVAAYMIGYCVTEDYLKENPHLKFAKGEKDTGVIISWNTEKPNLEEKSPIITGKPLVINPINWKRDATYAPASENLGSLINGELVKPGIADAKINLKKGVLECSTVNPEQFKQAFDFFPVGCYHSMDYGFYYENIRTNVKNRIVSFLTK